MSIGISISGGCLVLDGGCLATSLCAQNTDPCAVMCCQELVANFTTRRVSGASWSDDGTYYETNQDFAFNDDTGYHFCPDAGELTVDAAGLWQWNPVSDVGGSVVASGTLTSTATGLDCPPIDHTGAAWTWHNDAGGSRPDATLRLMTMDCEQATDDLALPGIGGKLMVAGIIGDFTTSASTTVSPIDPAWDGTLVWSVADNRWVTTNADPINGYNAVQQADGTWLNGNQIIMDNSGVAAPGGSLINLVIGNVGQFMRRGGHWYDPIGVAVNRYTRKGRMTVTLGVAP